MNAHPRLALLSIFILPFLAACDNAKKELGLTRSAPDEFAVVKRAPLEMPPEFALRPPEPGAPRPQEAAMVDQAAAAVLGEETVQQKKTTGRNPTSGEMALLEDANIRYNPDIRAIIDAEANNVAEREQPVVQKLLNIGKAQLPPAKVVDAEAEAQRLKENAETGKAPTDGQTPSRND